MSIRSVNTRRNMILRKGICLRKRWENPTFFYDDSNTKSHTEELAPPLKCDDCEFEGLSYKILNVHKGKTAQERSSG